MGFLRCGSSVLEEESMKQDLPPNPLGVGGSV